MQSLELTIEFSARNLMMLFVHRLMAFDEFPLFESFCRSCDRPNGLLFRFYELPSTTSTVRRMKPFSFIWLLRECVAYIWNWLDTSTARMYVFLVIYRRSNILFVFRESQLQLTWSKCGYFVNRKNTLNPGDINYGYFVEICVESFCLKYSFFENYLNTIWKNVVIM